ncbi:hypothetical protein GCM10010472_50010 [Pseudonocardia halophobica]|uniref:DUF2771 family protein n=1 Tax=Pseudonocardia halophobica TaxID=29401 RepID=A0A9W6LEM9_9PSEU|nr:DUF2771 family protein [Pseudonocardia halophobica]GLL15054.1 hypothetical protein GCM10017577_62030 [Pseudonocardia halophobica]
MSRTRRSLLAALTLTTAVVLAGCGSDEKPQVTWAAGAATQSSGPAQFCDLKMKDCSNDEAAQARLAVPAGTPVEVTVPEEVSEAPWSVVFSYTGPDGQRTDGRSPVFAPNARTSYTLTLPEPGDVLGTAQVQLLGAAPVANPDTGELDYPARATWVLVAQQ